MSGILKLRDKDGNFFELPIITGRDGKSAYEQAVEGGYQGTEQDFIAFLNGSLNLASLASEEPNESGGGAVGTEASTTLGGAVGHGASSTNGGAVGADADAEYGGAVGYKATTSSGGAVGNETSSSGGGAMGHKAKAGHGGAIGQESQTEYGGAIGYKATSAAGGAIGSNATATSGGAIGEDAKTSTGFAGGVGAKTVDANDQGIDAIQLGRGTNPNPNTLQVYGHQLLDANGKIPSERLPNESDKLSIAAGSYVGTGVYGSDNPNTITFDFVPKIVFISASDNSVASFHAVMPIIYGCATARINFRVDADSDRCYSDCIYLTWNDKTLSWYATNQTYKASTQLNVSGVTYKYVAIG